MTETKPTHHSRLPHFLDSSWHNNIAGFFSQGKICHCIHVMSVWYGVHLGMPSGLTIHIICRFNFGLLSVNQVESSNLNLEPDVFGAEALVRSLNAQETSG